MSLSIALGNIGLTNYESEVYLALLHIGRTTAGPIIRNTKYHRQHVYTALERLEERGLVSHIVKNNRKQFSAASPDDLLRKETERFRNFASIVPSLKSIQKKANNQLHVETLMGANELFYSLMSAAKSASKGDSLLRIFPGEQGGELYNLLGSRYSEYVKHVQQLGVRKRVIVSPVSVEQYRKKILEEPGAQLRVHETGFAMPTFALVTQELVDLGILGEEVVIVRIWNKALAKTYIQQFESLWKLAKTVKKNFRTIRD